MLLYNFSKLWQLPGAWNFSTFSSLPTRDTVENNGHVAQKLNSFWSTGKCNLPGWGGEPSLLGQVVHGADEVEYLHHVHPRDAEPAPTSRHVVRLPVDSIPVQGSGEDLSHWFRYAKHLEYLLIGSMKMLLFWGDLWCAAHEVVKEVVAQLDQVHDRLRALQDLPVQRGLDVRLQKIGF